MYLMYTFKISGKRSYFTYSVLSFPIYARGVNLADGSGGGEGELRVAQGV